MPTEVRRADLVAECAAAGVRVNALVTGNVDTPLYRRLLGASADGDLPAPPDPLTRATGAARVGAMSSDEPDLELGQDAEFPDDAIDDDEVSPEEQLLLDRKELRESGLALDDPDQFAE
jgi:NAD(P)-dependent dehydrogenase (short-subunit alcohol dehydrogenase family)